MHSVWGTHEHREGKAVYVNMREEEREKGERIWEGWGGRESSLFLVLFWSLGENKGGEIVWMGVCRVCAKSVFKKSEREGKGMRESKEEKP